MCKEEEERRREGGRPSQTGQCNDDITRVLEEGRKDSGRQEQMFYEALTS